MKVKFVGLTEGSTANLHMRIDEVDQVAHAATLTFIDPFNDTIEYGTATIDLASGAITGSLDNVSVIDVDSMILSVEPGDIVMNQNYGTQIVRSVSENKREFYTYPELNGQAYSTSQIQKIGHIDPGTLG